MMHRSDESCLATNSTGTIVRRANLVHVAWTGFANHASRSGAVLGSITPQQMSTLLHFVTKRGQSEDLSDD